MRLLALMLMLCAMAGRPVVAQEGYYGLTPLAIRQVGKAPVACLAPDDEPFTLAAVAVVGLDDIWPPRPWALTLRDGAMPITVKPGKCVSYRANLVGYKQVGGDRHLEIGETYAFTMRRTGEDQDPGHALRVGLFCIEQSAGKARQFLPYNFHADGSVTYPRCGKYVGRKAAPDGVIPHDYPAPLRQPAS
ncbi:hypothetical protein [Dyella japonica]|uniref:hypothetical protein n=1 Tax=Dyella japonica TaxID=231455 RepID=UPI0011870012|nr:hypothetical protein [Dyella japonica]